MKKLLLLYFLIPLFSIAQSNYLNFDFEDTDSINKIITNIDFKCYKTILEIIKDPTISASGNNCLCVYATSKNWREGCTLYTSLPKELCKDLRHIQIKLNSRYQFENKNGGFWVFATKGNKYLGKATTYSGYIPFPIIFTYLWRPMNIPVFPYEWYENTLDFKINEDPDELILGFYVRYGRVWYDNIQITLNDKPINNLVFQILK